MRSSQGDPPPAGFRGCAQAHQMKCCQCANVANCQYQCCQLRLRATTKAAVAVDRLAAIGVRRGAPAWTAGRPPRAACPPPFGHDRSADTKSPFGQHENACVAGVTKWSEMLPLLPIPIPSFQLATFTHWFCKRLCRQSPLFRVARGAGDFVWPEGAFRVRRCGVARQGSRKVQRRRRGEASSREAARLH